MKISELEKLLEPVGERYKIEICTHETLRGGNITICGLHVPDGSVWFSTRSIKEVREDERVIELYSKRYTITLFKSITHLHVVIL